MSPRGAFFPVLAGCLLWAGCAAWIALPAGAEDRADMENSLFENTESIAPAPLPTAPDAADAKSVGFSGEITGVGAQTYGSGNSNTALYTYTLTDLMLDARLPQGAKVFGTLEAILFAQNASTSVALREMFLDFNLNRAVYFRAGKQVLQWGRCYLWNPTDLINIERRTFVTKIGAREGTYGFKAHVPFGTWLNLYGFLDTNTADRIENTSGSFKAEWLVSNVEMALSGWVKKNNHPVWGYDVSARVLEIDIAGEASLSHGQNQPRSTLEDGVLSLTQDADAWTPSAALDFSRSFTVGDFKDRLSIVVEGFYNGAGYDHNEFGDAKTYRFAQPVFSTDAAGNPVAIGFGTRGQFLTANRLYAPNYYARYYAAVFTTFSRFLLTDMTLACNYIHNAVDQSGTLTAGLTYTQLNSLTLGVLGLAYLGGPDKEYTFSGQTYGVQLTAGLTF